jgi:glycerol-3-phosphate dehydrogenase
MKIIIGQGKWGKRLKKEFESTREKIKTWTHGEPGFKIQEADEIIIAVPGPHLIDTIKKFKVNKDIFVVIATKGLDTKGRLPSETVRKIWGSKRLITMGGACISTEEVLDMQYGAKDLELAGILKNVYSIGFSIEKSKNGDNAAARWFIKAWRELSTITDKDYHLSDFVVTCMSGKSRNNRAGTLIAQNKEVKFEDGQIAEGLHTAKMIQKYNLFKDLRLLRDIVKRINI